MNKRQASDIHSEVGIFTSVDAARQAVYGLLEAGFTRDEITVVCSDETKEQFFREFEHQQPAGSNTASAALAGGTIGAAVGGLGAIATAPAIGAMALWVAGPIAGVIGAGALLGGLVGAMMTRGFEKEIANYYQQAVLDGRILVAADHEGADHEGADHEKRLAQAAHVFAEAGAQPLPLPEG